MLFGIGAGLMQVPLANCVLHSQPRERSGIAAALLHASREVAGLYLDGYHTGLLVTVTLVTAGTAISFFTLRPATRQAAAPAGPDPAALAETGNQ